MTGPSDLAAALAAPGSKTAAPAATQPGPKTAVPAALAAPGPKTAAPAATQPGPKTAAPAATRPGAESGPPSSPLPPGATEAATEPPAGAPPAEREPGLAPGAAAEAWRLLHELVASQRPRLTALAAELGLAPAQLMALRKLEPGTPLPMRALAGALGCDNSNVTGIVDRLERNGLVERRSCTDDRRVKLVTVTPRGASLRRTLVGRIDEPPAELELLSASDQRALAQILRRALAR